VREISQGETMDRDGASERRLIDAGGIMAKEGADRGHVTGPSGSLKAFSVGAYDVPMVERSRSEAVVIDYLVFPIGIEDQVREASFARAQVPAHPVGPI
jgi:hypothetical protein